MPIGISDTMTGDGLQALFLVIVLRNTNRHLDLGPLHNEIIEYLGLNGRTRGKRDPLIHQLERPLSNSPFSLLILDDLIERE
jgi:hypothetical protein